MDAQITEQARAATIDPEDKVAVARFLRDAERSGRVLHLEPFSKVVRIPNNMRHYWWIEEGTGRKFVRPNAWQYPKKSWNMPNWMRDTRGVKAEFWYQDGVNVRSAEGDGGIEETLKKMNKNAGGDRVYRHLQGQILVHLVRGWS